jgi:hypothetical protein
MFDARQNWRSPVSASELSGTGWLILIGAALMFVVTIGRYELPPSQSDLIETTGEPLKWYVEEEPAKVRFAFGGADFAYDVFAGDVDAVAESLKRSGRTTVLYAPNRSLFGMLGKPGPTIWEVRHDTVTIRPYRDIVQSRNMNHLGIVGISAFFAATGAGILMAAGKRQKPDDLR